VGTFYEILKTFDILLTISANNSGDIGYWKLAY